MEIDEKNLTKLKKLFAIMDEDALTREEFVKAFEIVVKLIESLKKTNAKEFEMIGDSFKVLSENLKKDNISDLKEIKKEATAYCVNELKKIYNEHEKMMGMMDKTIKKIEDGKNANEKKILEQIENDLPEMGERIRDGLELLQGEDRLKMEAIDGLKEKIDDIKDRLEEIRNKPTRLGGGFSLMAMQQHLLPWTQTSVDPNGVLTDFVIGHTPNPTNSLEVMVDNSPLFETSDWTYNATTRTIHFLIAPPNGSKIRYKCIL